MSRRTPLQRAYLAGSTALGLACLATCLTLTMRQPPDLRGWAVALGLALVYGMLWFHNEELETPTANSPVLIDVSSCAQLVALVLVGPAVVPLLLAADALARFRQRGWRQPLGYLFNANQLATNATVTLAVIAASGAYGGHALAAFPAGTLRFAAILAAAELFARANHALLVAIGSGASVRAILADEAQPLALVTLIPPATGLLIATAAAVAPGMVIPLLIPVVLARYAIRAIARWARQHTLLEEQVAAQTESIRAQAAQITAQEQARHRHTVLLVHDLEKEFRLGAQLVGQALAGAGAARPGAFAGAPPVPQLHAIGALFERGLAMSADILLGSSLRAGAARLQVTPTDLTALVAAVTGRYMPVAAAADVQLTLDCDALVRLAVDAPKLDRALANLLTNAIDYTKGCAQRRVVVALSAGPEAVMICVRDSGIGIAPEQVAQIDARVGRLRSGAESHHGNGLGLVGVAAIVALHDGRIHVTSPGPDRGTTVTIHLPPAPAEGTHRSPAALATAA